jgi:RNA polymerase sigma factor (sigma-70 family)
LLDASNDFGTEGQEVVVVLELRAASNLFCIRATTRRPAGAPRLARERWPISQTSRKTRPSTVSPVEHRPTGLPPFDRLVEDHGPALLRFCAVQAGTQRAEDVFQETMVAALRAYDTVRDPASLKSWVFSIAARKAVDAHRSAARTPQPVADIAAHATDDPGRPPTSMADPAAVATANDDRAELWDRVGRLPAKQREAVGLRFLGDLSHREIAASMEISEAAARRNVFEGLTRLRTDLEPDRPSPSPSPRPPPEEIA